MIHTLSKNDPRREEFLADLPVESQVKAAVRERDEYKCRDCGMTAEEHQKEYDRALNVHRLVPGVVYHEAFCVTLCEGCHNKKPRRTADAFWATDLRWFAFNLYDPADQALYRQLADEAERCGVDTSEMLARSLRQFFQERPLDYCI